MKVSRPQFYEIKRAFKTGGLDALSEGLSVVTLTRYLGHSSPDIAYRVYVNEIPKNIGKTLSK